MAKAIATAKKDRPTRSLALVTGASSGIGFEVSRELARRGFDIVGVSRHEGSFATLAEEFPKLKFTFIAKDLATEEGCLELLAETKDLDLDFFFANAGAGCFGSFADSDTATELKMIKLNVISNQILLKEYLRRFTAAGKGHVLVSSSAAAFAPAPYMSAYYATKVYVYYLCLGYWRELRDCGSQCRLSILCPGPVATNFEKAGNLSFQLKPVSAAKVAVIAVKGALRGKTVIVPTLLMKCAHFFSHLLPKKAITGIDKKSANRMR